MNVITQLDPNGSVIKKKTFEILEVFAVTLGSNRFHFFTMLNINYRYQIELVYLSQKALLETDVFPCSVESGSNQGSC